MGCGTDGGAVLATTPLVLRQTSCLSPCWVMLSYVFSPWCGMHRDGDAPDSVLDGRVRFLVALVPVRDLRVYAKHLFGAAKGRAMRPVNNLRTRGFLGCCSARNCALRPC